MHHRILPLLFTLLFGVAVSLAVKGQGTLHHWRADLYHPDPAASPKLLFTAIIAGLPTADVTHTREGNVLTIDTDLPVEVTWLETTVASTGFTIVGLWRDGVDMYGGDIGEGEPPAESPTTDPDTDQH